MDEPMVKLGEYLQKLESKEKVSPDNEKNRMLQKGCEEIVDSLLQAISQKDPRFKFTFYGTGSYYDGVKVGNPDEFDYIAEIQEFSAEGAVTMERTSDPGFVQLKVPSMDLKRKWKDCLVLPHHIQSANASAMYHDLPGEVEIDTMELSESDLSQKCILGPFKMQRLFKKYIDGACLESITLPENWEHGGFQRPNYSGCRRHGPAVMLQFVHKVTEEEIKINIDVTLGIAVPLPTNAEKLNLYVRQNVKGNGFVYDKLQDIFNNGPQLHVIPLYSNVLIKTHRYQNKYAWRISCSLVETALLDAFADSGPKLCLRMLKAIRDKFLCEGRRRTVRKKRKRKRKKKIPNQASANGEGSLSSCSSVNRMPSEEYTKRMKVTQEKWVAIRERYIHLKKEERKQTLEETVGPTSPILVPPKEKSSNNQVNMQRDDDISDATELEEKSRQEAFKEFRATRMKFQRHDISDMVAEPGSGEYYGPKTFMSSIEIKTFVLRLLASHSESDFWSMDNIVKHVNDFLRSYHTILLERKMMKNFFFDSMVCAPISEEQRLKALEKFNILFEELNQVMEGSKIDV